METTGRAAIVGNITINGGKFLEKPATEFVISSREIGTNASIQIHQYGKINELCTLVHHYGQSLRMDSLDTFLSRAVMVLRYG